MEHHDAGADERPLSDSGPISPTTATLALTVLAAIALTVVAGAWIIARNEVDANGRASVQADLESRRAIAQATLGRWQHDQLSVVEAWSRDPRTIELAEALLADHRAGDDLVTSPHQLTGRALMAPTLDALDYEGFFLVAPDGTSLASLRDDNVATPNLVAEQQPDRFERLVGGEASLTAPQRSDVPLVRSDGSLQEDAYTMFSGAPIRRGGEVIAVLLFRIPPQRTFDAVFTQQRWGTTGEALAVSEDGLLLVASRFEDELQQTGALPAGRSSFGLLALTDPGPGGLDVVNGAERQHEPTLVLAGIRRGETGVDATGYRSYLGREVVGAWTWDESLELGFAVEMSEDEALGATKLAVRHLDLFATAILVILHVAAGLAVAASWFSSRQRRLREQASLLKRQARMERTLIDQLQASNADLDKLATHAAHDLQEPLRKIITFGNRLQSTAGDDLNDKAADSLERVMSAAARMRVLVDDLLDFARVTSAAKPDGEVDLLGIVTEAVEGFDPDDGSITVVGDGAIVIGSRTQLGRVVTNLIGNAVKFRHPDRPAEVRVEIGRREPPDRPPEAVLAIIDNGIGLDPAYAERIFEMFERLHPRRVYGGSGLGLAICRRIVEDHGGTITATGVEGTGSTFTVAIPLVRLPAAASRPTVTA